MSADAIAVLQEVVRKASCVSLDTANNNDGEASLVLVLSCILVGVMQC